jgi:RNA polymerase sigma-70 factor (ECF subfamily)
MQTAEIAAPAHTKEEFTKLIEPLFNEIFAYAFRMTKNRQAAEDLTAETFTRAWRYFAHFKLGTNFRAWIYSVLTNIFINDYRKKKREPGKVDYDKYDTADEFYVYNRLSKDSAQPVDSPERLIQNKFDYEAVRKALDKLPDDFKQVVLLSDLEGFSYNDIVKILKIPLGTVRSRLNRGRHIIQKLLWEKKLKSA